MRGRPSKPTSLKALEGNAGHRSHDDRGDEPAPTPGVGEPPRYLPPAAKRCWFEIVAIMEKVPGWLTGADRDILARYCDARARWEHAVATVPRLERKLDRRKLTGEERGFTLNRLNLLTGQRKQADKEMTTHGNSLGLNPAARTRIRVNPGQAELPLDGENVSPFTQAQNLARG
jgi:P27 family predicted phage terminase small subunit